MAQASTLADHKPSIRRTGKYTFETKSRTREGVTHTQDVLHLKCSCEAGEKGMHCWHLVLALQAEQWYKRAEEQYKAHNKARRQAVPAPAPTTPTPTLAPTTPTRPAGMAALLEAFGA
jgi:IS5 family transposase